MTSLLKVFVFPLLFYSSFLFSCECIYILPLFFHFHFRLRILRDFPRLVISFFFELFHKLLAWFWKVRTCFFLFYFCFVRFRIWSIMIVEFIAILAIICFILIFILLYLHVFVTPSHIILFYWSGFSSSSWSSRNL